MTSVIKDTSNSTTTESTNVAVQLIEFNRVEGNDKSTIKLNDDLFKSLVTQAGYRPVSVICICGPSRQGKSFMLGYMIRCLEALEKDDWDWMGWDNSSKPLKGFKFENGMNPVTQGIWVWNRPFIVKNDEDKEIAVLLVDTQGTNKEFTTTKDMSTIVGLSLLMSSVTIFNFFNNLQEDVLAALNMFVQYGLMALENVDGAPFQKLMFLIRDWNMSGCYPQDRKKFIEDKLKVKPGQSPEVVQVREMIRKCFEDVDCFLLPYIGENAITNENFTGSIGELSPLFAKKIEEFISSLISSDTLVVKRVLGNSVTMSELKAFLDGYIQVFNSNDVPSASNIWAATSNVHLITLVSKSHKKFMEFRFKMSQRGSDYLSKDELESALSRAAKQAIEFFQKEKKFTTKEKAEQHQQQLVQIVEESKTEIRNANEEKRKTFVAGATSDATIQFRSLLEKAVGLDASSNFHEESVIIKVAKQSMYAVIEDFKQKLMNESEESVKSTEQTLRSILASCVDTHMSKNALRRAAAEEEMQKIVVQSVEIYHEQLRKASLKNQFSDFVEFANLLESSIENRVKSFENRKKPGTIEFQKEYRTQLEKKMEEVYSNLENNHKLRLQRFHEHAKLIAQITVNECLNKYKETMKEGMSKSRSLQELYICHQTAWIGAKELFYQKCPGKNNPAAFIQEYEQQLEKEINKTLGALKEIFDLRLEKERADIKSMLVDCTSFYHDHLQKPVQNNMFVMPQSLFKHHLAAARSALHKVNEQQPITEIQKIDLEMAMGTLLIKYRMENDMKLNYRIKGEAPAIGIDLGTTYCCVAVYFNGQVIIVPNQKQDGVLRTPSFVAYEQDGSVTVGAPAMENAFRNPKNTIFDAKRMIGRPMSDEKLKSDMKCWPFTVVSEKGVPKIKLSNGRLLYPEEICAELLKECREMAEDYLELPRNRIKKAVITVPAYFGDGQRQATVSAGRLAGLEVLTILNEPIAAAIAYSQKRMDAGARKVLIFDMGGGTFDVAVLDMKAGEIEVLGVSGDTHLGGQDFDSNMMKYCAQKFKGEHGIDLLLGKDTEKYDATRTMRRLHMYCENAKKNLSTARTVEVSVLCITPNLDLNVSVSRKVFEEINAKLFSKSIEIVEAALKKVGVSKESIDDIVLVGGSTRSPRIQELLTEYFGGKVINRSIHPDQVVAYGAAIKAAMLNGEQTRGRLGLDSLTIQDVTPFSLGVENSTLDLLVFIPKNSKIPTKRTRTQVTVRDNQTSGAVKIYHGEDLKIAANNKLLGEFKLNNIPPAPRGHEPIDVTMEINEMGILEVTAVIRSTKGSNKITIQGISFGMCNYEQDRILGEANPAA